MLAVCLAERGIFFSLSVLASVALAFRRSLPVEKLFPDMPAAAQTALWKSKEVTYREISTKLTPLPGLLAFLENCEAAGLAMIVVTNAPRVDAVHTLTVLGLFER